MNGYVVVSCPRPLEGDAEPATPRVHGPFTSLASASDFMTDDEYDPGEDYWLHSVCEMEAA